MPAILRREDVLVTIAARAIGGDSHGGAHGEDGHGHGDQEHGVIEISVSDTGPGLGDDERDRVWERMYRGPIQPDQRGLGPYRLRCSSFVECSMLRSFMSTTHSFCRSSFDLSRISAACQRRPGSGSALKLYFHEIARPDSVWKWHFNHQVQ